MRETILAIYLLGVAGVVAWSIAMRWHDHREYGSALVWREDVAVALIWPVALLASVAFALAMGLGGIVGFVHDLALPKYRAALTGEDTRRGQ